MHWRKAESLVEEFYQKKGWYTFRLGRENIPREINDRLSLGDSPLRNLPDLYVMKPGAYRPEGVDAKSTENPEATELLLNCGTAERLTVWNDHIEPIRLVWCLVPDGEVHIYTMRLQEYLSLAMAKPGRNGGGDYWSLHRSRGELIAVIR